MGLSDEQAMEQAQAAADIFYGTDVANQGGGEQGTQKVFTQDMLIKTRTLYPDLNDQEILRQAEEDGFDISQIER